MAVNAHTKAMMMTFDFANAARVFSIDDILSRNAQALA